MGGQPYRLLRVLNNAYLEACKKSNMQHFDPPILSQKRRLPGCMGVACICLLFSSCEEAGHNSDPGSEAPTYEELAATVPDIRLNKQGDSATAVGDYQAAIGFFQESMELAAADADSFVYYDSRLDLACVYDRLGELDKAIEIGEPVLEAFIRSGDSTRIGRTYATLAAFYSRADMPEKNIAAARKGFDILKSKGSLIHQCAAYNQMAFTYSDAGQWAQALPLLDSALLLMRASGILDQLAGIYLNLGDCHRNLGNEAEARHFLNAAAREADSLGLSHIHARSIERLSQMAEAKGAYVEALRLFKESASIKSSIFTEEKARAIQALESEFETREKEQQILLLKAEKRTQATYRNLALALLALSIVIGLWGLHRWREKANRLKEQLTQNRERLSEVIRLLAAKNAQLVKRDEVIRQYNNNLSSTKEDDSLSEGLINLNILTDEDWMAFKSHFERSYPGYLSCLRAAFPDISQAEERLFLLYKLNLNRKEISNILGVSESTVKKSRTRLRKRLELDSDQNLEEFIRDFK